MGASDCREHIGQQGYIPCLCNQPDACGCLGGRSSDFPQGREKRQNSVYSLYNNGSIISGCTLIEKCLRDVEGKMYEGIFYGGGSLCAANDIGDICVFDIWHVLSV